MAAQLTEKDAILVVDVQNDFCPGGALEVPEGDRVIPVLNEWLEAAKTAKAMVFASRDWHPKDHSSFREQGGEWPVHCVQFSQGAQLHEDLELPIGTIIIDKGKDPDKPGYSVLEDTDLADGLKQAGIQRLFVGGLATEHCVRATVMDALKEGVETHVIRSAARGLNEQAVENALKEMREAGAIVENGS